ncbi:hypothetical protein [Vibrio hangzhouensis]|uniref:Uncharacterized protein n=1 Tax=Vibrio hangzhouensis TaxID=462991 RepID=A0A1H5YBT5_9VIBR|nr:hypothetical protein [Vibrio hangzhouensis]SEG21434.1 hypothetical protein SAMN04488244_1095 [Vibrio hangzhouensis]
MFPGLGTLTNNGTMPISGGHAGPATSGNQQRNSYSVGGINMGGGVNPWLIGIVLVILVYLMVKKK